MPEHQTSRNSDNQGIKETVKQNNQTGKAADREKPQWGSRPWGWGCVGGADLRGNWDSELTVDYGVCHSGRNSQSHRRVHWKKCTRDKQASCTVPSLAPPPQAAPQCSKEGCPAWVSIEGPGPLQLTRGPEPSRAKMKDQTKTSGRELSNKEVDNYLMENLNPW